MLGPFPGMTRNWLKAYLLLSGTKPHYKTKVHIESLNDGVPYSDLCRFSELDTRDVEALIPYAEKECIEWKSCFEQTTVLALRDFLLQKIENFK